jgi:hypothetical protein
MQAHAPFYIICGLSGFYILVHKRNDFRENVIERKKVCFYFLYKFCLKYFHSKNNSASYFYGLCEVSVILVRI